MKRGRGRTRKNALPISSGKALAKKRGRLAGNTPEMKEIAFKTPPNFSPATSSTHPLTHCSKPSIEKNSRTDGILGTNQLIVKCRSFFLTCSLFIDSQNETRTTLEEEERNFAVCIDNSCVLPAKGAVMEKPTDNGQVDACISSLNGPADVRCITPTLEETPRPAQRILANSSNLNTLSPAKTSSLLLDKAVGVPSTALHHLTPAVSRPKVRIG